MIQTTYTEPYRPQYHFSPPKGWMNDPNGLLYYDGEYHLYYQAIPYTHKSNGPKFWGHAISRNLVHWHNMPIALSPDEWGEIFSGSAVVDWYNSSGLQSGPEKVLIALYTSHAEGSQQQSLAYSNDRGRSWQKYARNPIITNSEIPDFRDPKVFWHEPSQHWVMILAVGDRARIYTSLNLKEWELASEFGPNQGSPSGVWECPDLFPLAVDGDPNQQRWIMLVSLGSGAPNGGTATEYFVGDFDGRSFHNASPPQQINWMDHGSDNYATVTFSDMPDGRRLGIGWMSNWMYAYAQPTFPWRGCMTVPREFGLTAVPHQPPQLTSQPIKELESLRQQALALENRMIESKVALNEVQVDGRFELLLDCDLGDASEFSLCFSNTQGEETVVGYDVEGRRIYIDRQRSGRIDFDQHFAGYLHSAKWLATDNQLRLHIFVDWSSVELFVDNGRLSLTDQIFPNTPYHQISCHSKNGQVIITQGHIWQLDSIWQKKE